MRTILLSARVFTTMCTEISSTTISMEEKTIERESKVFEAIGKRL
jgi:hypothetical protein